MGVRRERVLGLRDRERLRVLRVIGRLNMGGPTHQAAFLSGRRFHPDRYETLLAYGNLAPGEASLADLAEAEGAEMRFVPQLQQSVKPLADLRALLQLIRIARRYRPQIVDTHTAKAGFLGRLAAMTVRPRPIIVHTYHGHVLEGYFGKAKSRLYLMLERALARVTDRLVGVSQATVDDLVRLGVASPDRFEVVHMGLDLAQLAVPDEGARREVRTDLELGDDDLLLIFVGRLVPIKRLDVLIEALALARRSERRLRLAVVGDGDQRPGLERQAADLGIGGATSFLGYRRELKPLFSAADIAVLSSDNEGTPVSLIEAAASGLPAVATDVGGVDEVVTADTGTLVPAGDSRAFAEALVRMADDGERREHAGARARDLALANFSAERLVRDVDRLYGNLTSGAKC
jgi:glycosyltransferase involved in cell wall biosynthesis